MTGTELRQLIVDTDDIPLEIVEIPEWGGVKVQVCGLSGADRNALITSAGTGDDVDLNKIMPDLVILSAFDPDSGERIFQATDRDVLLQKAAKATDRISEVAFRLSGLGPDSEDKAGKDSSSTESDDSTS